MTTPTDTQRDLINAILEGRAVVEHCQSTMADSLDGIARMLIRAASLQVEYASYADNPLHAPAPAVVNTPTVAPLAVLVAPSTPHTEADAIARKAARKAKRKARKAARKAIRTTATQAVASLAPKDFGTMHSEGVPAQTLAEARQTISIPASRPYVGTDRASSVYDAMIASLANTDRESILSQENVKIELRGDKLRLTMRVDGAVSMSRALAGQDERYWGDYIYTTVHPNPKPTARYPRLASIVLGAIGDAGNYSLSMSLVLTAEKQRRVHVLPDAPALRKGATAADRALPLAADENYHLAFKGGELTVTCMLRNTNIVGVKRGRNWGFSVATTRRGRARYISLGDRMAFLLELVRINDKVTR